MKLSEYRHQYHLGPYAWPGGYPRFAVMEDGEVLCFACLKAERRSILSATGDPSGSGWEVAGFDINYEDAGLFCANCHAKIPSAYGE